MKNWIKRKESDTSDLVCNHCGNNYKLPITRYCIDGFCYYPQSNCGHCSCPFCKNTDTKILHSYFDRIGYSKDRIVIECCCPGRPKFSIKKSK